MISKLDGTETSSGFFFHALKTIFIVYNTVVAYNY